ncbi:MAG: hypothetical protein JXR03_13110 [Cyclobacteriaceae bacterium]
MANDSEQSFAIYKLENSGSSNETWVGFIYQETTEKNSEQLSLSDALKKPEFFCDRCYASNGGVFVISEEEPNNLSAFTEQIIHAHNALNRKYSEYHRYFHWVESPNDDAPKIVSMPFNTSGEEAEFEAKIPIEFEQYIEDTLKPFYTIRKDTDIEINAAGDGFDFLYKRSSRYYVLDLLKPEVNGYWARSKAFNISFKNDAHFGKLNAIILYDTRTTQLISGIETSIRFFTTKDYITTTNEFPYLKSKTSKDDVSFHLSLDPSQPLNPERTAIHFTEAKTLGSYLTLNTGKAIELKTTPELSGLAFAKKFIWKKNGEVYEQFGAVYLTPNGAYKLHSPTLGDEDEGMLLCGLSGTELISFENGDVLAFHPQQPGFAPKFPILKEEKSSGTLSLLDETYTSTWVTITKGSESERTNYYVSQAEDTPVFVPNRQKESLLDVNHIPSTPLLRNEKEFSFPLIPSALVKPESRSYGRRVYLTKEELIEFEQQIIQPTRKIQIESIRKEIELEDSLKAMEEEAAHATTTIDESGSSNSETETEAEGETEPQPQEKNQLLTTTPQGFLVDIDETSRNKNWSSLVLANNAKPETAGSLNEEVDVLEFKNLIPELQSAFQTNELFLVITNPELGFHDYFRTQFDNKINISGWPFLIDLLGDNTQSNTDTPFKNILIFKFCTKSIVERIEDKSLWTSPEQFNDVSKIGQLQQWIKGYIQESRDEVADGAIDKSEATQDEGLNKFVQAVEDPNWNGMLALKVNLELADLPDAIKSILAGIDLNRFSAHHFGVEVNKFEVKDKKLEKNVKSSLFGLISYYDEVFKKVKDGDLELPDPLPEIDNDFDFRVLNLQALFRNSALVDFNSKIQLSVKQFFNDPIVKESYISSEATQRYSVVLKGQYEQQNGRPAYNFYQDGETELSLDSSAVASVKISNIGFTLVDQDVTDDKLTTRFSLLGALKFHKKGDFDLFTYDQLMFSGMILDLNFNLNPPRTKEFILKPETTIFPGKNSKSGQSGNNQREGGFARHFPMQLLSIVSAKSMNGSPDQSEYLSIDSPVSTKPISGDWYGLKYKINLGSLGSLTEKAGFEANLLVAWSPGSTTNSGQIFMKLPFTGGSGSKGFSIQGVLKMAVGAVKFEKKEGTGEYALLLTNLGVKLLGLKLPPSGNTILYLFGDPDVSDQSGSSSLGWFGAYKKTGQKKLEETNAGII